LERVAALGWPAPETATLGDWLLRAAEGWTRRANSALLLGDPGRPIGQALEHVHAWYTDRGLVPRLVIPLPSMAAADHAAARLGWVSDVEVEVLTAPVVAGPPDPDIRLASTPDTGWAAAYRTKTVPEVGRRILTAPQTVTFGSLTDGDSTVAIGRGVVMDGWLGVTAMEVLPEYRRRGFAGRMLRTLLAWGASHGATRCYLQVETSNEPAGSLYTGLGFTRHHRCRNRHRYPVHRTEHRGEGISR
jgi:GNAT superfamily N-acetyltransferase